MAGWVVRWQCAWRSCPRFAAWFNSVPPGWRAAKPTAGCSAEVDGLAATPPASNGLGIEIGRVRICNGDAQIDNFTLRDAAKRSLVSAAGAKLGLAAVPLGVRLDGLALGSNPPLATVGSVDLHATLGDNEIAIDQTSVNDIRAADDLLVIPNVSIARASVPRTAGPEIVVPLITVGGTAARLERRSDGSWKLPDAAAVQALASGLQEAYALLLANYAKIVPGVRAFAFWLVIVCDGRRDCRQAGADGGQPVAASDIRCHRGWRRLPAVLAAGAQPGGVSRRRRRHRRRIGNRDLSKIARVAPAHGTRPGRPGVAGVDRLVAHAPRFRPGAASRSATACEYRARADRAHQRGTPRCRPGECYRRCRRRRSGRYRPRPCPSGHTDRPCTGQHQQRDD